MKSFRKCFNEKDEYYTPKILINFLVPFLKEKNYSKILCPFDEESSNYVKIFKSEGFKVVFGHLNTNKDFFNKWWLNEDFDILISNPPFSKKNEIIEILTQEKINFMLLMNLMSINYQDFSNTLLKSNEFKSINFIIPNKKVSFDGNTSSFSSGYITNVLDSNWFVDLPHNNSNKHFEP